MKVGHVPVVPYDRPGAPEAAEAVAALIARYAEQGTPLRAVMLTRLGPNVWHDSPAQAMADRPATRWPHGSVSASVPLACRHRSGNSACLRTRCRHWR